jgi:hypothetical protein
MDRTWWWEEFMEGGLVTLILVRDLDASPSFLSMEILFSVTSGMSDELIDAVYTVFMRFSGVGIFWVKVYCTNIY